MSGKGDLPAPLFLELCFVFQASLWHFLSELLWCFIEILTAWLTDAQRKAMQSSLSCAVCKKYSLAALLFLAVVLQLRCCSTCSVLNCLIKTHAHL